MLEPYAAQFENHLTETTMQATLKSDEMSRWKKDLYPYFSDRVL